MVEPARAVAEIATSGSKREIVRRCFFNIVRLHHRGERLMRRSTKMRRHPALFMPLAALCRRHSSAHFTICMCDFDFRQAQRSGTKDSLRSGPSCLTRLLGIAGSWRSYNRPRHRRSHRPGCNIDSRGLRSAWPHSTNSFCPRWSSPRRPLRTPPPAATGAKSHEGVSLTLTGSIMAGSA